MAQNFTTSTAGKIDYRQGCKIYVSNIGDSMAFGGEIRVEGSNTTPVQEEIDRLKYQISNYQETIRNSRELLLISRTKLAAVKKLVK